MATDVTISHYSVGTATVAANGTAVTGQGTAWADAIRTGDLFGTHRGLPIRILSINSNTSLTLAHPWPGPAQTAAAYEIQHTPRDMGYRRAIEELISDVSEGNLPLLAALLGAPNKLAYFDSSHSMALADLTALGRSLLASASPAALWSAAGLSDGYVSIGGAQSITGRKTFTDAVFIEANTPVLDLIATAVSGDGDRIRVGSVGAEFRVSARSPTGNFVRNLLELPWDGSGMTLGGARVYTRRNIRGVVSQSGGVPTGAIIEDGSNANGQFVRYADGTQICRFSVFAGIANVATGSLFMTDPAAWTFPSAFSSTPTIGGVCLKVGGGGVSFIGGPLGTVSNLSASNVRGCATANDASVTLHLLAIGRWF